MHMKPFFLIPFSILFGLLLAQDDAGTPPAGNDPFVVVLDAGHGGHDPGNLGNGFMEKNIALNIVLEVGRWLEKQPDVKVIYTRKDDSFVDLYVRGKIANEADADLFVSVHCDSHSSDAHGAGTFVLGLHANEQNFEIAKKENSVIYLEDNYETRYAEYDINSPESIIGLTIMQEEFLDQSILLAKLMQDKFSGSLKRNDRKVKQAGFIVLHQTFMPSVLVETGFLTNKNEGSYLNSNKGQLEMGKAIADAILTYKQNVRSEPAALIASAATPARVASTSGRDVPVKEPVEVVQATESPEQPEKEPLVTRAEPVQEESARVEKELQAVQTIKEPEAATKQPTPKEVPQEKETVAVTPSKPEVFPEADTASPAKETTPPPAPGEATEALPSIVFKVQLLASTREVPLRPEEFNGLGRLSKEPYKNMYRYLYGETGSYREAQLLKSNADAKGYTSSYIVAYKDGERIPVPEARKYVKE